MAAVAVSTEEAVRSFLFEDLEGVAEEMEGSFDDETTLIYNPEIEFFSSLGKVMCFVFIFTVFCWS